MVDFMNSVRYRLNVWSDWSLASTTKHEQRVSWSMINTKPLVNRIRIHSLNSAVNFQSRKVPTYIIMAKINSKVTSKPSISKASEIKSSLNTTMKKMRKRVTFKGAPNTGGSKSSSAFNVAGLRASLLALDKTCTGMKPYFKKTKNKLFPGRTKTPNSSPVQSNRTSPRSRIEEVDERIERSQYLFYPGEWMCDRCGWKAYNKHWCSKLTDDDKIFLRQSKVEQGKDDEGADKVADQLASLAME